MTIFTRFLCVSDPCRDENEIKKQRKYWIEKYGIKIKGEKIVKVLLSRRLKDEGDKKNRVVPIRNKPYIFPVECLEPNKRQKRYENVCGR